MAPSPWGEGWGEGELVSRRFHGLRIRDGPHTAENFHAFPFLLRGLFHPLWGDKNCRVGNPVTGRPRKKFRRPGGAGCSWFQIGTLKRDQHFRHLPCLKTVPLPSQRATWPLIFQSGRPKQRGGCRPRAASSSRTASRPGSQRVTMDMGVGPSGAFLPSWPLRAETARGPKQSLMQTCRRPNPAGLPDGSR